MSDENETSDLMLSEQLKSFLERLKTDLFFLGEIVEPLEDIEKQYVEQKIKIHHLEEELKKYTRPINPPIDSSKVPNLYLEVDGQKLVPTGPGEIWTLSGERRWTWDINPEITVILDSLFWPDGSKWQHRVIVHRARGSNRSLDPFIDLPIEITLKVVEGNTILQDRTTVRVHPSTRPCITFNRIPTPRINLPEWKSQGKIPNYSEKATVSLVDLNKHWQWKPFPDTLKDNTITDKPLTYDPISEKFGFASRSWSGGVPLANEASMLPPWSVALLHAGEDTYEALDTYCTLTAESSGNYPIHYFNKNTGKVIDYSDNKQTANIPVLNGDNLPVITTRNGFELPQADIAHDMGLVNLHALITKQRYYVEELESWVLLGSLTRKGDLRSSGLFFSGQVRATAWWLRNLFHLGLIDPTRVKQLRDNILDLNSRFANPDSPEYRSSGVISIVDKKASPWMAYAASDVKKQTATGHLHFLSHVLGEIHRSGIIGDLCEPVLTHVLKSAEGTLRNSFLLSYAPWLQHAIGEDKNETWESIIQRTFANLKLDSMSKDELPFPLTRDIRAWYRGALISAYNLSLPWAINSSPIKSLVKTVIDNLDYKSSIAWWILPD